MTQSCPRPCGRLATAAVFVSIGVVQFIAGLILLKSKYVYLLSGPDFWTAASNLSVGVLLGMSASVWKDVQKKSFKHIVRRNLLASLVASAIIINLTTAIILILGEGNALLSIQLENDAKYSSASDILAYSYASSVCSPIISVVVAIVFLTGMWFRVSDKETKTPEIKSILKKNSFNEYNWVYKGKQSSPKQNSRILRKELSFKSLSSSSEEDSFNLTDAKLWSNTVHSIEYLNTSSRRGLNRAAMNRHSKLLQEPPCECGEHVEGALEKTPNDPSRVSFANDPKTLKYLKCSPFVSQRHHETDQLHPDLKEGGDNNFSSLSYAEFKKMRRHYENSKQRHKKKRMLLIEHPVFQPSKFMEGDSFSKLATPEFHIPRAHTRTPNKTKSTSSLSYEVKAEMHVDPKGQDSVIGGNSSETQIIQCEDDAHSYIASTETTIHKDAKFQRASTFMNLNYADLSQPKDESVVRKVCRTSTAANPCSSKISQLDISDIQTDSMMDPNESFDSEEERDISVVASPQPAIPQINSNIEVDDSFIDALQSNALAGEIVKVRVNSLPHTSFHSKLIPVPIPVVSSFKNNPLKRKQKEIISKAMDVFPGRDELSFSSFHGDPKIMNKDSNNISTDTKNQKYEDVSDTTVCEMSPDDKNPSSPAHTSGYSSAIFENSQQSGSEHFQQNLSSSETNTPYYTPQKKFQKSPFPRNLDALHVAATE